MIRLRNPRFFLLCTIFVILFCVLGVWQLHRYHDKKILLTTYKQRLAAVPAPFLQQVSQNHDLQFQSVAVDGYYVNQPVMLVQNKFYQDRLGYEVITPLKITGDKKLLLVDRGWIEKPENSEEVVIKQVVNKQHINGYIKLLNEYQFTLGDNILDAKSSPLVMQKIDINEISRITHQDYYPFILRLSVTSANGYVRDWTLTTITPERHLGYAIQWFVMAFVLLVAYVGFCCERAKK